MINWKFTNDAQCRNSGIKSSVLCPVQNEALDQRYLDLLNDNALKAVEFKTNEEERGKEWQKKTKLNWRNILYRTRIKERVFLLERNNGAGQIVIHLYLMIAFEILGQKCNSLSKQQLLSNLPSLIYLQ